MPAPREIDLLVHGAAEVATALGSRPLGGGALGRIAVLPGAAVACDAERVVEVGPESELAARYRPRARIDARGGTVIPGLVDAHTHPVFAGTREDEFEQRVAGRSYVEIARAGGGSRPACAACARRAGSSSSPACSAG